MGQVGNNISTIVVTNLSNYDYRSSWKHISTIVVPTFVLQILGSLCSLVGMSISPVGNNLSSIVTINLIDYDYVSRWETILTILTCLVDYDHVSGDIGQINLDIFIFLKGTAVWSDSMVNSN